MGDEFDVELIEGELSNVLGSHRGQNSGAHNVVGDSSTTNLIANAIAELAKTAGGTVAADQAKKEQDAAIAKAKAAGLPVPGAPVPGAKPPSAPSKHYAGLPLYGWVLIGLGVTGASVVLAEMLKPKKANR